MVIVMGFFWLLGLSCGGDCYGLFLVVGIVT